MRYMSTAPAVSLEYKRTYIKTTTVITHKHPLKTENSKLISQ